MTKKYYFVLRNIDPIEIDNKYSFLVSERLSQISEEVVVKKTERTKITELAHKTIEQQTFSYLDESKKEHLCILTMIDQTDNQQLSEKTSIYCFWCRSGFDFRPIGCPIKYIPNRIMKSYYSEITKDNYILRESVTIQQSESNDAMYKDHNMDMTAHDFYITDGIFCSFNCCLAFILDNHNNPIYTDSEQLLNNLYIEFFGMKDIQPILPAPSWRILKDYGGNLSIDEFRRNFYKIEYKNIDNMIYPFIKFRPVGFLFEKQIRI